jgi:hypothetical protein
MFPTLSQYNKVIQNKGNKAFSTLNDITFIPARTSPIKIYSFGSGSYAVVFKAVENYKNIAIRCFIGSDENYAKRYKKIDNYLKNINEAWKSDITFLDNEIKVEGVLYPVLKMDWVEGKLLNNYINDNLYDNEKLSQLQEQVINTSTSLESHKIAHGDIQCGNIIIKEEIGKPKLKLIDYDGLYIPEFKGLVQFERGREEFQHPLRSNFDFDEKIDRFSFLLIITALEALKFDKTLWLEIMQGGFNTLDNLLFQGSDFKNPNQSILFKRLKSLNKQSLNFYVSKIIEALNSSEVEKICLYNESKSEAVVTENINVNTPKVKTDKESDFIKITSNKYIASVRDENYQLIGVTPLTIDKNKYLNQELKIIHALKVKTIVIKDYTIDSNFDFDDIITPKPQLKIEAPPLEHSPPFAPVIINPQTKKKADISGFHVFIVLLVIGLVVGFLNFYSKNNKYSNDNSFEEEVVIEEVVPVVEEAAPVVEEVYAPVEEAVEVIDSASSYVNYSDSDVIGRWTTANGEILTFYKDGDLFYKENSQAEVDVKKWYIYNNKLYMGFGENNAMAEFDIDEISSDYIIISAYVDSKIERYKLSRTY